MKKIMSGNHLNLMATLSARKFFENSCHPGAETVSYY